VPTFTILVVILGTLAGIINFAYGLIGREQPIIAVMRFAVGIISFAIAGIMLYIQVRNIALPTDITKIPLAYLFIALGLFVGATLMLPATVERTLRPAETAAAETPHTTGKLGGESGVRIANQNEEWVN